MRLTPNQIEILKDVGLEVFSRYANLSLFGSRIDDSKRGGDIDLYVSGVDYEVEEMLTAKMRFLVKAKQKLGERRIDLIFCAPPGQIPQPIQQMAKETGIAL